MNTCENPLKLCPPYEHNGVHYTCGRIILKRDPTGPEACPSYGGGGLRMCTDCQDVVLDFMRRAYDARAVRMEHKEEGPDVEPF
jgi:hypothetical protein